MRRAYIPLAVSATAVAGVIGFAATVPTSSSRPQILIKSQGFLPFADAPINYRSAELDDPIARLETRLERGDITLTYEPKHGYLPSVLQALRVPVVPKRWFLQRTVFSFLKSIPQRRVLCSSTTMFT